MVIVSHDLGMVERLCDRGVVLAGGRVIQDGPVAQAGAAMSALE